MTVPIKNTIGSFSTTFPIYTSGSGKTTLCSGLTFETSGLRAILCPTELTPYVVEFDLTDAFPSSEFELQFEETDAGSFPGIYSITFHDDFIANSALAFKLLFIGGAGMEAQELDFMRTVLDHSDNTRAGLLSLPNAYAGQADGVAVSDGDGAILSLPQLSKLLDYDFENGLTLWDLLNILSAWLSGKTTGGGTSEIRFRNYDDSKDILTLTVDTQGNRSLVTYDP
jgi:hypothetical protein